MLTTSPLDHFPKPQPREKQVKALDFVYRAIERDFRHIVIAAPTGIGKSACGVAICDWVATTTLPGLLGGYYLVTQKLLQDQLETDFVLPPFQCVSLKSATEYSCPRAKNCAVGNLARVKCPCRQDGSCPYAIQKNAFLNAKISVTNYPYFFTERTYVRQFGVRQVIVCDETHSLERQVIRFIDLVVSEEKIKEWSLDIDQIPVMKHIEDFVQWTEQVYLPEVKSKLETLTMLLESPDQITKMISELDQHLAKVNQACSMIKEEPSDWVYWQELDKDQRRISIARPLDAAPFVGHLLFNAATVKVYMSAYPGRKEVFCRSLGLDVDEVAWCSLGSTFPIENRPIVMGLVGAMGMKNVDQTLPTFLKSLDRILTKHAAEKGIIHANSYKLGQAIYDYLQKTPHAGRLIFPKNGEEREEKFKEHSETLLPSVIISPSMTEGFDFAEGLARWQVIAKVPYPSLGDKQISAKKAKDPEWYSLETVKVLIQACGRVCRSDTDWGVTYILDSDFLNLWDRNKHLFPAWFTKAFVWPKR